MYHDEVIHLINFDPSFVRQNLAMDSWILWKIYEVDFLYHRI